jgi:uncharacterized protein (TIGR00730 family)
MSLSSLCVFCASSNGNDPTLRAAACSVGQSLAENGIATIYGGASVGMMGQLADSALAHGGVVIGVIPRALVDREIAHTGLTRLEVVDSMHQRKARMASLADAFVALPGGFGTLDEFIEIVTWARNLAFTPSLVTSSTSTAITTICSRSFAMRLRADCCASRTLTSSRYFPTSTPCSK